MKLQFAYKCFRMTTFWFGEVRIIFQEWRDGCPGKSLLSSEIACAADKCISSGQYILPLIGLQGIIPQASQKTSLNLAGLPVTLLDLNFAWVACYNRVNIQVFAIC